MKHMLKTKDTRNSPGLSFVVALAAAMAIVTLGAGAQTPPKAKEAGETIAGDPEAGEQQFEAVCAECHGAAATAPTLRGIIGRPIASVATYYGYSEALKAKKSLTWTEANLNAYLKSPPTFAPGNLMYREFPDAKMRADIIAYLATLPPPR
jgi:cytochrome c